MSAAMPVEIGGLLIGLLAALLVLTLVHVDLLWWPVRELFARFVQALREVGRRDAGGR